MQSKFSARPRASVAIASYNCEAFLEEAINSALRQTLQNIEVIVIDDASKDGGLDIARRLSAQDARVRVETLNQNRGPAGARNKALELARGDWFVVLDSDDLMHPDRLRMLIEAAERDGMDVVADDLLLFSDAEPQTAKRFLRGHRAKTATDLGLADYLQETRILISKVNLGYLKPVVRLDRLNAFALRYDESLRIGEDDDFLARMLAAGLKGRIYPHLTYFYRRHGGSVSHRLNPEAMRGIADQERKLRADIGDAGSEVTRGLDARRRANRLAEAFVHLIAALKARRLCEALSIAAHTPLAALRLRWPLAAVLGRRSQRSGIKLTIRQKPEDAETLIAVNTLRSILAGNL